MSAKITDREIDALGGDGKSLSRPLGAGLYLRVSRAGVKAFAYRYRNDAARDVWLTLGRYGRAKGCNSLSDARAAAAEMGALKRAGLDPSREIERRRLQQEAAIASELERVAAAQAEARRLASRKTVADLFSDWHRRDASHRSDGGDEAKRSFEKDVLPYIGRHYADQVRRADVVDVIDRVRERGALRMSNRLLADLRRMFRFGLEREIVTADPTVLITRHKGGERERDRILSPDEIAALADALPAAGLEKQAEIAIWLILATACRVGELSAAEWAHVDLDAATWRIPAENAKNGREHLVHLSDFAADQFRALEAVSTSARWVISGRDPKKAITTATLQKQFRDRQVGAERRLKGRSKKASALALPSGQWRAHDLRRSAATLMGTLGVAPHVIDRCLNHVEQSKVTRIYQRQTYIAERKAAFDTLGARLEILARGQGSTVVAADFGRTA